MNIMCLNWMSIIIHYIVYYFYLLNKFMRIIYNLFFYFYISKEEEKKCLEGSWKKYLIWYTGKKRPEDIE